MNEKHVTSLKLSKKLKELGVKQESEFYWDSKRKKLYFGKKEWFEKVDYIYSAPLSSELDEILPKAQEEIKKLMKGEHDK